MSQSPEREAWGSRIGMILATAGSAVGIGNLLRFPGQAANNGGGAFMIPYLLSLLLFGLPLMWIAWTIGRMGGRWGHGTTPGMFDRIVGQSWAKYAGVIGVALPLVFILYYTYIEAWCLAYSWYSLTGAYADPAIDLNVFFHEFVGDATTRHYFSGHGAALTFLAISVALNVWVLYRGVVRGIELVAKIAIPLLLLFCIALGVWVLSLGGDVYRGLDFLWKPDFSRLFDYHIWLAAAGQIFFTLSLGYGCLECFASYAKQDDDIVLTGLTASSINEFVEVIFGSLIAIPAAAFYFGPERITEIASSGTFSIGMVSMPEIFRGMGTIEVLGSIWFLLLFFAAFTSSVGVAQPVMAFLQDEARVSRGRAALVLLAAWGLGSLPVVYYYKYGGLDEMDFWAGTLGLVVFAMIEAFLFAWVLGIDRAWAELHRGAHLDVPRVFRFVMRWITPFALLLIFLGWLSGAIFDGTLAANPKTEIGFERPDSVRGHFMTRRPAEGSDDALALAAIESELFAFVQEHGRDVPLVYELVINPGASPHVDRLGAEPAVIEAIGRDDLLNYALLVGPSYERAEGETMRPYEVRMLCEVRYRERAIWIVRLVMIAINAAFAFMVWRIWRARAAGRTA
ncbi:MAG: sodium-dependent transporter [Acidobacteria bacterium]|nr:sodium-dependent transporter [Acidobacteriota bacterium]